VTLLPAIHPVRSYGKNAKQPEWTLQHLDAAPGFVRIAYHACVVTLCSINLKRQRSAGIGNLLVNGAIFVPVFQAISVG